MGLVKVRVSWLEHPRLSEYIYVQLCCIKCQFVNAKTLHHFRTYKTCHKFLTQAKSLYTNDIQQIYRVISYVVDLRQNEMDLSTYIGRISSPKEEFLSLMSNPIEAGTRVFFL